MIDAIKEAITDRIKTPILGTLLLLFLWFNYLQIHRLIINFKDIEETIKAYNSIDFLILKPLGYTLLYVLLMSLTKILSQNWDALTNLVSGSILNRVSKLHFTENLEIINKLREENNELKEVLTRAKGKTATTTNHLAVIKKELQTTKEESERSKHDNHSQSDLTVKQKSELYMKVSAAIGYSNEVEEILIQYKKNNK